ncbi:hypothetical protein ACOSP7_013245 [Xanthoceras sorbifolium]
MSLSNSFPFSFDPSLLIFDEPSLDFHTLAQTLNFNLPLKLDKINYVNWKAQLSNATKYFIRIGMEIPSILSSAICTSLTNLKLS